jgi:hypothetical protein
MGPVSGQLANEPLANPAARVATRSLAARLRRFGLPIAIALAVTVTAGALVARHWYDWFEKRVVVVAPGALVRGAYQKPNVLRRLIEREKIKTIVTLAALPRSSDRYRDESRVVEETGVHWVVVPIVDSRPSLEQMASAADLLADRQAQPIFFHCIAGHHRTSLALAAYRIRYEGWSADRAWREVSSLPWARPAHDVFDHRQIEAFAARYGGHAARR